jgi:serine-type D-Ala-D-Ala carboxypeptidase (penicillin-binding protein 5/6)
VIETSNTVKLVAVLTDVRSSAYLAGEDASARLPMASTTKIMVALVALEEADLEEGVAFSQEAAASCPATS